MPDLLRLALRTAAVIVALGAGWGATPVQAQQVLCDAGDREVKSLEFEGNEIYPDGELSDLIVTTQSGWMRRVFKVLGTRFCVDSTVVAEDAIRLLLFYNTRGFRGTDVKHDIFPEGEQAVRVRFTIQEGRPVLVDSVQVNGVDSIAIRDRLLRSLPLRPGMRLDRALLESTRDTLTRRLRNAGYPQAQVLRNVDTDTSTLRSIVWYDVASGARARIDSIHIEVRAREVGEPPGVRAQHVRSSLGLSEGEYFSARDLESVKRGLYLSEAFQHVDVSVDTTSLTDESDSTLTVNVTLIEGELHNARAAIGWGNYDCLRVQGNVGTANFLGGLRRADLTGRISRIGSGPPLEAGSLCPRHVRDDFYADTLNYYIGATYSQPALFGRRVQPTLTVYSERRSEYRTYIREVLYGLVGAVQFGGLARLPTSLTYQLEYGRTGAQPAYFCAAFNICDVQTYDDLTSTARRQAVLGWTTIRSTANDLADPSRGSVTRLDLRHASPAVGSDAAVQFSRAMIDATWYFRVFGTGRFVFRARGGTILSDQPLEGLQRFIPPQERMYAGGGNSVRGFGQNELGPLLYQVDTFDIVDGPNGETFYRANRDTIDRRDNRLDAPTGGDNVIVANAELRLRSPLYPELIQYAIFADAGEVWNRGTATAGSAFQQLKVTPGAGVRVFTPIGPLRVDIAYGPRRLRPGPVYFTSRARTGESDPVFCVSPNNTLAVTDAGQQAGACPASYAPPARGTFFSRLRFHFSIGQPF
jgi:outer membrane protein insertion porin family/translocation and assembly module TamA